MSASQEKVEPHDHEGNEQPDVVEEEEEEEEEEERGEGDEDELDDDEEDTDEDEEEETLSDLKQDWEQDFSASAPLQRPKTI